MNAVLDSFDHRADIYSLGIIILQLFIPISTTMELITTIKNCKLEIIPQYFKDDNEKMGKLIVRCLS